MENSRDRHLDYVIKRDRPIRNDFDLTIRNTLKYAALNFPDLDLKRYLFFEYFNEFIILLLSSF